MGAAVAVSLAGTLLLWELGLRFFAPQPLYGFAPGLFVEDARAGYRLQPSFRGRHTQPDFSYPISINRLGFRGPEPVERPTRTVLVLGDSIPFGAGVEEGRTAVDLFRARLAAARPGADVLNASAPGYSLPSESALLEETLASRRIDLTLLFLGWHNNGYRDAPKVRDGRLALGDGRRLGAVREFLNDHSHLYALIKRFYYARMTGQRPAPESAKSAADSAWTQEQVRRMRLACRAAGSRFAVVFEPWDSAVAPELEREKRDFLAALRRDGVDLLDLETDFARLTQAERRELAFKTDPHWNEKGSRFVADILASRFAGR